MKKYEQDVCAQPFFRGVVFVIMMIFMARQSSAQESQKTDIIEGFGGKIGANVKSFVPDWLDPVKAPVNAPNIVLILLDDVGFADTSPFGGVVQTPALDKLASHGLIYNQFHTAGICSPTRASLLTGRNPHKVGWGSIRTFGFPGYNGIWKKSATSVAEVLRTNGYSTAAFGKWHNTPYQEITVAGPFDRWPTGLGFEYFYGFMGGMASQWEPVLWRNTCPVQPGKTPEEGYHLTSDLVDDAIDWIQTHESLAADKPYFVYLATGAAHTPHHVPGRWIEKYHGKFDLGWDKLREDIFARQKKLGVIPKDAKLTQRPKELPAWDSLTTDERQLFARQMEVYAAFIAHTDHEIGRLIKAVQTSPDSSNTLILYIVGDNGGAAPVLNGWEDMSHKEVPIQERLKRMDDLGGPDYINEYAAGWAWLGSTPFQWMKQVASHFGATRNPLIVSWPEKIHYRGEVRSQFAHVTDIVPTIYDVTGITPPDQVDGVKQQPLDGVSVVGTFNNAELPSRHKTQYFEVFGNRAIYSDGWMAVARHSVPWLHNQDEHFHEDVWELYNITNDFSQANDLANSNPNKLRTLQELFEEQAQTNSVYPLGTLFSPGSEPVKHQKDSIIYYDEFPGVQTALAPLLRDGAFKVTSDLLISNDNTEGVIYAYGGRDSGFVLYVEDGHITYEYNYYKRNHITIQDSERLSKGKVRVILEYTLNKGKSGGTIKILVDDRTIGSEYLKNGIPGSMDKWDIGKDSASPVTDSYCPPFPFKGQLERVTVENMN